MKRKSLSQTKRFLANAFNQNERILTNVSSSTAIETGESIESIKLRLKKRKITTDSPAKPV
jgi:hypothetical protein